MFFVDDVVTTREVVLGRGGHPIGEVVTLTVATGTQVT